jgi:hypothetical protein
MATANAKVVFTQKFSTFCGNDPEDDPVIYVSCKSFAIEFLE